MEHTKTIVQAADSHMKSTLQKLETEIATIRTGKASPALLDGIKVDYYGNKVPLKQVANVAVPDPKLITVQPWEKPLVGEIVKAIQTANLGLNPQSDGTFIRIPVPPLTEERRRDLVKAVKHLVEVQTFAHQEAVMLHGLSGISGFQGLPGRVYYRLNKGNHSSGSCRPRMG